MAEEFTMPKLGLTMTDGTIREWLVDDGAYVHAGEPILVIETDKVETEVEARADGVLRVTGVVGSTYECGSVIGYLLDEAAADEVPASTVDAETATPGLIAVPDLDETTVPEPTLDLFGGAPAVSAPVEVARVSDLDAAIAAADGVELADHDGMHLSDEAVAAELDRDLHDEIPEGAPSEDETVDVELDGELTEAVELPVLDHGLEGVGGTSDAMIEAADHAEVDEAQVPFERPTPRDVATRGVNGRILASPRARAAAYEAEISLAVVAGTGPGGRIVHDDIVAAIAARAEAERAEADRRHAERLEAARHAEAERLEAERLEAERLEAERLEAERLEAERVEAERLEAERAEAERLEAERLEAERLEAIAAEADRLAALPPPPDAPESARSSFDAADTGPSAVEHLSADSRPVPLAAQRAQTDALLDPAADSPTGQTVPATGGARLLADFLGVDLAAVVPSSGGRITREDVGAWVRARLGAAPDETTDVATASAPRNAATEAEQHFAPLLQEPAEVVPFNGMRGLIAQRMHASLNDMAQLTLSVDVDMAGINAERERRRGQGQQVPGYTAWVVAAASQAIEEHGYVNSQITADGIALLPDVHVGVAVALDEGLIVPVIEHANLRTVEETHAMVADLAGRARIGKLKFEELEGATFSVTALGMFGVDMFTPVINPPNTAILGVGRLRSETGWSDGQPVEKTVMTLSLTWDHRAFDGAPAAEFAQTIVRLLQEPTELV